MKPICSAPVLALALVLSACSTTPTRNAGPSAVESTPPAPYVRVFYPDSNMVQLQIAVRKFVPDRRKGPAVWMSGVCHIAETNYFADLQQHLDSQTVVLFEGIDGDKHADEPGTAQASHENLGSLQFSLADSLGLAFQLQAINYQRAHFRNSDLTIAQIKQLVAETGTARSFDSLLQMMEGGSWLDGLLQMALRLLGTNPKVRAMSKLALIEILGQIQGDPAQLRGLPAELKNLLEVLIARRNDKVFSDLEQQLAALRRNQSLSVFYGTGHMPDLEARLRQQFHYRAAEQIWFTAMSVDLRQAGISDAERRFIENFVNRQLKDLLSEPKDAQEPH